ncbi:hypothetical protein HELRODRAFT_184963 [Helobdella robusta]|uniref:Amidase domain-containing protein n=1 Tax=Helobdella robusta TaxID=6412 RepID=T1FM76_HELRO|nr:hypothetical protein HELRODRAFT_184963 [Helobdella robusta]ESO02009.1 hypothetical protein HELRODRAFT_184963 [Helobdella robusta]
MKSFLFKTAIVVNKIFLIIFSLLEPILKLIYDTARNKKPLPPIKDVVLTKSAQQLSLLIRSRKVTCKQVVEAFIKRIEEVNDEINAVVYKRYKEALIEADNVDQILSNDTNPEVYNEINCPFLGVPITIKEAIAVKGCPQTSGLLSRKNVTAEIDADTVALLKKAGAIIVATTNISEVCMWYESSNLHYGRTKNAYHRGRIVGGSSGGEGCLQSVAGSAFGLGSDVGGSIRMPAFFNGVFGHKTTSGVVSNSGQYPMAKGTTENLLSTGPLCRYASDLIPILKVIVLPEHLNKLNLDQKVCIHEIKLFYMDEGDCFFTSKVHPDIRECMEKAVDHFRQLGCEVERVNWWQFKYSLLIWACKMSNNDEKVSFNMLMGNMKHEVNPFLELLLWLLLCPRHTLPAICLGIMEKYSYSRQLLEWAEITNIDLRNDIELMLGNNGVFLYPTLIRYRDFLKGKSSGGFSDCCFSV